MKNIFLNISFRKKILFFMLLLLFLFLISASFMSKKITTVIQEAPSPTIQPINITPQPVLKNQGQADYQYNKAINDFYLSHPWYKKIPPKNNDYFIGYDASTNSFFVELYPKNSSSVSIDNQVTQLKYSVVQELGLIGVNTSSYKIDWLIYPQ